MCLWLIDDDQIEFHASYSIDSTTTTTSHSHARARMRINCATTIVDKII